MKYILIAFITVGLLTACATDRNDPNAVSLQTQAKYTGGSDAALAAAKTY